MRRRVLLQAVPAAALLLSTTEEVLTHDTVPEASLGDVEGKFVVRNEWTSTHDMIPNDLVTFFGLKDEENTWVWTVDKYYPKGTSFAVILSEDGRAELEVING